MKIGGLQKTSLLEYPGRVCAVIFTRGCNFRCPYCHNPELVVPKRFVPLIPEEEIFAFLSARKKYLNAVTVTGGEPCIQRDIVPFIRAIKDLGYSVKLDTNGSYPGTLARLLKECLPDYVAMDVKAPPAGYARVAGVPVRTARIARSIALIIGSGVDHEFRTTVVKSQLDGGDVRKIGAMVRGARRFFLQKFVPTKTVDRRFLREKTYGREEFEELRRIMREYVADCRVR